jgi:hypothetical protein
MRNDLPKSWEIIALFRVHTTHNYAMRYAYERGGHPGKEGEAVNTIKVIKLKNAIIPYESELTQVSL